MKLLIFCLSAAVYLGVLEATRNFNTPRLFAFVSQDELQTRQKNCTKAGLMCEDCVSVSYCIQLPGGGWLKEEMEDCDYGKSCQEATGSCTDEPNPSCEISLPDNVFPCRQTGIFPDLYNCQLYYMCMPNRNGEVNKHPITMKCSNSFYYDPLTTLCRKKMDGACPKAPNCTTLGETKAIPDNPSLYYVCLKNGTLNYAAQAFACPDNQYYNEATKSCTDPSPKPFLNSENKCTAKGNFPDVQTCNEYYSCRDIGEAPLHPMCAYGSFYDTVARSCVPYKCSHLRERW